MTDAELQAIWDENMEAPPPKRLSRAEFFKKYQKDRPEKKAEPDKNYIQRVIDSLDYALPGVGGVADAMLGFASKTLDFAANAPEAIWDVAVKGQSPDLELARRYGTDVRDNTTARLIQENPFAKAVTGYRAGTDLGKKIEHGEEWVLGKLGALGTAVDRWTYSKDPEGSSGYGGNLAASTLKYGVPLAAAHGAIKYGPGLATKTAGTAQIQAAKGAQKILGPESDILSKAVERVGDNRFNTINLQLPMINDRRNIKMEFLGKEYNVPDWYGNALNKGFHAVDMTLIALRQRKNAANALDGFTPNVVEAMQHVLQNIERKKSLVSAETGKPKKQQRVDYLGDVFHGQLGHILASLEKMQPHNPRTAQFRENFGEYLFPDNVRTLSSRLSATDIEAVMGKYLGETLNNPNMIDAHILPFVKDMAVEPFVHLSSKPFHEIRQNIAKMKERGGFKEDGSHATYPSNWRQNAFSFKGQLPLIHQVQRILKEQGESATKESIIAELRKMDPEVLDQFNQSHQAWKDARPDVGSLSFRSMGMPNQYGKLDTPISYVRWKFAEPKPRSYEALDLEKNIVVHGGYVSVGQNILSTDTLLATVQNRAIFDMKNPDRAAVLNFDSYQLGTGHKAIDTAVTAGSDTTRIFFDWIPWKGKGKGVSPDLYDMVVGGIEAGGAVIEQMRPLGFTLGPEGQAAGRGRRRVSKPIPITGGRLHEPGAKQMESMGLLEIPEYTKQLMREKSRMYE
jgi:hypothetical protein